MSDLNFQELAPGVHAVPGGIANRGLISHGGSVLVIDSGIGVAEAMPLRVAAQQRQKDGTLFLFNTHPHGDHVYGNQLFVDGPIIAHEGVRDDLLTHGEQVLAGWRQNAQMIALLNDVVITLPTLTFQEQITLFIGDIEVQLLYLAHAHSPSDSVAWLPHSRTLFAGDLLFNTIVPAMPPGGSVANWIQALEKLEALDAQHVIPGHGPIQTAEALTNLRQWFLILHTQVREAQALGWNREATIIHVAQQLQNRASRGNEERLPNIIGQAFDELRRA